MLSYSTNALLHVQSTELFIMSDVIPERWLLVSRFCKCHVERKFYGTEVMQNQNLYTLLCKKFQQYGTLLVKRDVLKNCQSIFLDSATYCSMLFRVLNLLFFIFMYAENFGKIGAKKLFSWLQFRRFSLAVAQMWCSSSTQWVCGIFVGSFWLRSHLFTVLGVRFWTFFQRHSPMERSKCTSQTSSALT